MKRILLLIVLLTVFVCLSSTRAQTIYLRSGQKIPIEGNGLHSIVPLENGYAMAFKGKDGQIMHVFHLMIYLQQSGPERLMLLKHFLAISK